jgi:DNA-binding Lrp family transcriptional regulator
MELSEKEKLLLTRLQKNFPLTAEPWKVLADEFSIDEKAFLDIVTSLKKKEIIRQISGIFDSRKIGYHSSLIAATIPASQLEEAAALISSHPGVSHNYERDHLLNVWFTLSIPNKESLEAHVARLNHYCHTSGMLLLPALRVFRIGVQFDLTEKSPQPNPISTNTISASIIPEEITLSQKDIEFIRIFQKDFPIVSHPYAELVKDTSFTEEELLAKAEEFIKSGKLRRVAGLLHHRNAGYLANAMIAWQIPEDKVEDVGIAFAQNTFVSHCYQRPACPAFPYNLYTMVHGKTKEDCQCYLRKLLQQAGNSPYQLLYSTREFKKKRIEYYSTALEEWKKAYPLPEDID